MNVEAVLARLQGVWRNGSGWQALCPAHADKNPSLSIDLRDGKILFHCHAGCSQEAVLAALGIEARELFLRANQGKPRIAAKYDYCDEKGMLLYQKLRYEPKNFKQRRPNGKGGWIGNLDGVRRVLYRLPEVVTAEDAVIVEGEKDADAVKQRLGMCGTTGGSAKDRWLEEYTETLKGKRCVVIPDANEPGRRKAGGKPGATKSND